MTGRRWQSEQSTSSRKKKPKSKTKFSEMWKPSSSSSSQLLKLPSHNNKPKFPRRFLQKSQHNSRFLAQPRTPTKNFQKPPNPAKLQYQQLQAEEETELKTHHNNNNNNNKNKKPKTLGGKKKENLHYTQSLSHSTN
jgi:hypothetical protein